jgi:hypothetical protein
VSPLCRVGDDDAPSWRREFGLEVTARSPAVLIHGAWVLALTETFIRDPQAERFCVFQDDILAVRNLRQYLERCPYPDGPANAARKPGYWNLYQSPSNAHIAPGGTGFYPSNQLGKGALALVFSREAVITLLSSRHLVERPCDPHRGWRCVDGGIVDSFKKAGWAEYVHGPSLVVHTGKISTVDKRGGRGGKGRHVWPPYYDQTTFPGTDFDALSLLGERVAT